jgi:hypothetical protein
MTRAQFFGMILSPFAAALPWEETSGKDARIRR